MPGRILFADPIANNRIAMRVALADAFYDVALAASGQEVLTHLAAHPADMLIASHDLSDMTGAELCETLRATHATQALPIVLICNAPSSGSCCHALHSGADDCLPRPVDQAVLLARMRSLLRARDAEAELRLREDTQRALGMAEPAAEFALPANVVFVAPDSDAETADTIRALERTLPARYARRRADQVLRDPGDRTDVFVIADNGTSSGESLSLLSELRANSATRHAAILFIATTLQSTFPATALDLGANDLMIGRSDISELTLRLKRQIARKRTADRLRNTMQDGLRAALTDPLTGLYNRRYALPHLERLARQHAARAKPFAVIVIDLDHFKTINDTFGHAVGDQVLTQVARRLGDKVRAADMVARLGGEEFLITMPETDATTALGAAERLRQAVSQLTAPGTADGPPLRVTASIGVAVAQPAANERSDDLIQRADRAMYRAKSAGRNRVEIETRLADPTTEATGAPTPPLWSRA